MKKNTRFHSKCSAFKLIIILLGTGFAGTALAQGSWSWVAPMNTPRYGQGQSVVNGKIYVFGGIEVSNIGCTDPGSQSVEEYDPVTNTWDSTKTPMPTLRKSAFACAVNDKIYVIGGGPANCEGAMKTLEVYDPQADMWDTTKDDMQVGRHGPMAGVVNGKIYVIGGMDYTQSDPIALKSVEEYDPIMDVWTPVDSMQTARAWFTACVFDDKIYAFGGVGSGWGSPCMKTVEVYDPVANTWEPKNDLPYGIQNAPAVVIDSMIYLFGGALTPGGPPVDTVLQYDPILDTTTIFTQLPSPAKIGAPSELNGKIYIVGGFTNSWPYNPDSTVLVYTPPTTGIEGPSGSGYRPQGFALQQNYPNPSNPATTIEFFIPRPEFVTLKVYNILGEEVATLVSERLPAGNYKTNWDAGSFASGVYLYRIQAGSYIESKKMILLR